MLAHAERKDWAKVTATCREIAPISAVYAPRPITITCTLALEARALLCCIVPLPVQHNR